MYAAFQNNICFCIYEHYAGELTHNMRQITQEQYFLARNNQAVLGLDAEGNVRVRSQQELDDDALAAQIVKETLDDEKRRTDQLVLDFLINPLGAHEEARLEVARRLNVTLT